MGGKNAYNAAKEGKDPVKEQSFQITGLKFHI
jgi:hypothetical protein